MRRVKAWKVCKIDGIDAIALAACRFGWLRPHHVEHCDTQGLHECVLLGWLGVFGLCVAYAVPQIYGSQFFHVEPQLNVEIPDEVFLAVNPRGILIINPETKDVLVEHPYSEVRPDSCSLLRGTARSFRVSSVSESLGGLGLQHYWVHALLGAAALRHCKCHCVAWSFSPLFPGAHVGPLGHVIRAAHRQFAEADKVVLPDGAGQGNQRPCASVSSASWALCSLRALTPTHPPVQSLALVSWKLRHG